MLSELEKKILESIQEDIPLTQNPYQKLSQQIGISESAFIETLQQLCERGVVRRFGATLRHQNSGYSANAMVAWSVDEDKIDAVGQKMAACRQISHCYRRNPTPDWPYNLYTMVHAKDKASCKEIARKMALKTSVDTYTVLFSQQELKKTSMKYFPLKRHHN